MAEIIRATFAAALRRKFREIPRAQQNVAEDDLVRGVLNSLIEEQA